jgi:hypothetical protein
MAPSIWDLRVRVRVLAFLAFGTTPLLPTALGLAAPSAALRPIIIAPAQFGVPKDYEVLARLLEERGHKVYVAPLSRLSW